MVFFAFAATCCVLPSEAPACTGSQVAAELGRMLSLTTWRERVARHAAIVLQGK